MQNAVPISARSLAALLAVIALAIAVACAPEPEAPAPATPAPAVETPAPEEPAVAAEPLTARDDYYLRMDQWGLTPAESRGGTLNYYAHVTPADLDPHEPQGRNDIGWSITMLSTYDPLVSRRLAPDIYPLDTDAICRLCDSWELAADEVTYTFNLRQNVLWHDGEPMTADDVVFSFERAQGDPRFGATRQRALQVSEIEAIDDHTVRMVTRDPLPDFLIDIELVMIAPKHILENDDNALVTRAVGTGPMRVVDYDRNRSIRFEANENYYVEGRPFLDRMEVFFGLDASARQAGFLAGQLDFFTPQDRAAFEPIQAARPDIGVQSFQAILGNAIGFNTAREPWDMVEVRRALHMAIDRDTMNEQLAFGGGVAYQGPNTAIGRPYELPADEWAQIPGYRTPKSVDLDEARELLAEAGLAGGFQSSIFTWAAFSSTPQMVETLGPMAEAVGINLELEFLESGVANQRWTQSDFDLVARPLYGQSWPNTAFDMYRTDSSTNFYGISDPELDDMIDRSKTLMDADERNELLRDIQRYILEHGYLSPLIELNPYAVWSPNLYNFRHYSLGAAPYPLNGVLEVIWKD